MPLTTIAAVKTQLGITDATQDAVLTQILAGVEAAVHTWTKRDVLESQTVTFFLSGNGKPDLILPHRPCTSITSVHVDQDAYYGTGTDPFPAETLWTEGTHFVLKRDAHGIGTPVAKSAVLHRLGGSLPGSGFTFWPVYPVSSVPGLLGASRAPYWPMGDGNIKVVGVFGYSPVPSDLALAVIELSVMAWRRAAFGVPLQSESYAGYSYSLAISLLTTLWKQPGTAASTLASYRELAVA